MTTDKNQTVQEKEKPQVNIQTKQSDAVYAIGMIGAWVYFFKQATTTEEKFKAFFKGLVWPAFLVYELFVFLNKG